MTTTQPKSDPLLQLQNLREIMNAYQKSRTLFTACELDVFTILGETFKSSKDIANTLNANERAIDRLLNALVSMKLLEKQNNEFHNTQTSYRYLVKGNPEFLGDLTHNINLWEKWSDLTYSVHHGKPRAYLEIEEKSDEWIDAYINSAHWRAIIEAPKVIEKINLKNVHNILDLGGGRGHYALELIKAQPNSKVTIFELPKVAAITAKHIEANSKNDNINVVSGDFLKDSIGSGYDLVLISNVIHSFSIWENVKIMQKVYDALNTNGTVVINEIIISDSRTEPTNSALYSLNMLVNTLSGDSYTETDIWIMLREAWFRNIYRINTEFETSLMFGTR